MVFEAYVAAWEQASESLLRVCAELPPPAWDIPSECPGWSVKDVAAHVAGVEAMLLGRPRPEDLVEPLPPYVRNEVGRLVEPDVQARRHLPPEEIIAELQEVLGARLESLTTSPPDPDAPVMWVQGPTTMTGLMRLRVFDVWAHEQDIRRATDRPGNLTGPAADVAAEVIVANLPKTVAKNAGAPPGSVVVIESTGAYPFTVAVGVDENGRGALLPAPWTNSAVTATLRLDWVDLVRLACGRCEPADAALILEGDLVLGWQIAAQLPITP